MSPSQSPTQSNHGRSYDHYFLNSTSHEIVSDDKCFANEAASDPSQSTSHGLRTLHEDDTGAVNFDSPIQDDGDLIDIRFEAQDVSQPVSFRPFEAFPETPAPENKNPFGQRRKASQILPPSQLFAGTQSAPRRHFSPTSSRPSPNVFYANDISPNPGMSSPLKTRGLISSPLPTTTSSPAFLPAVTSPHVPDAETPNLKSNSPRSAPKSSFLGIAPELAPTSEYEPMRKSQERRCDAVIQAPAGALGEEEEEEDAYDRKQRANLKRAAAQNRLEDINVPGSSRSSRVEVPSTNNKTRTKTQAEQYLDQCHRIAGNEDSDAGETVADSQEQVAQPPKQQSQAGVSTQSEDENASIPSTAPAVVSTELPGMSPDLADNAQNDSSYRDAIPETSPTERQPRILLDLQKPLASAPIIPATSSGVRSQQLPTEIERSQKSSPQVDETLVASNKAVEATAALPSRTETPNDNDDTPLNPPMRGVADITDTADFPSSPPALSTRARRRVQLGVNIPTSTAPPTPVPASSTSSLSSLGTITPILTSSTTLGSPKSEAESQAAGNDVPSSPAVYKNKRRLAQDALPRLKTRPVGNTRHSGRLVRQPSDSTDELARSPTPTQGFEQSLHASRTVIPRQARASSRPHSLAGDHGPSKLFEKMAFAISFQGKKPGENAEQHKERMSFSKTVEKKIREAGGTILPDGFDELFEALPVKSAATSPLATSQGDSDIKLLPGAGSTGFAALIADGHSRKVKYMQALALGLPCIATRWITTCIDKGELVDWVPYLLCAGQSAFLGDAIRSRTLAPYNPAEAKLADVIAGRERLLDGNRVLLVMKRAEESKKMAYVFLARVLGASLSRVYSVEEARTKMKASEDLGHPFDWVYVDDKVGKGDLFAHNAVAPKDGTRKRKRRGSTTNLGPAPKKIRTLSDELVIQSLILGRLIEEGEMEE